MKFFKRPPDFVIGPFVDERDTGAVGRGCGEHDDPRADKVVTIPHRGKIG